MNEPLIDDLLDRYFRPAPAAAGFTRRVLRGLRGLATAARDLPAEFAVEASARGVTRIRPLRPAPHGTRTGAWGRGALSADRAGRRLADRAREELREYVRGERSYFTIPVDLSPLPRFQRRVLEEARLIPFGTVLPYGQIARRIGHPGAARAVGTALARNPVPFVVPCHRVLHSGGGLGGYAFGLGMKAALLRLEQEAHLLEGCSTTGIVCRAGCTAGQRMRPDHVIVFASVADARSVGYRPCKRCAPADAEGAATA